MEFLVTHGVDKKVVKSSSSNITEVKRAIRKAFNIMSNVTIKLQKFDQSWGEYINVEDGGEIENKAKLIVISAVLTDIPSLLSTSSSALSEDLFDLSYIGEEPNVISETDDQLEIFDSQPGSSVEKSEQPSDSQPGSSGEKCERPSDPQPGSSVEKCERPSDPQSGSSVEKCERPSDPQSGSSVEKCERPSDPQSGSSGVKVSKEWPTNFKLPLHAFPRELKLALDGGRDLDSNLRHKLVNAVFEEMTTYTWCPHPFMYDDAARAIISAYPYLADKVALCKPYETWKRRLGDKFRNERKIIRRRGEEDAVGLRKTKKVKKKSADEECPPGEDDESMKAHIKAMQLESRKRNPDREKVSKLMGITFHRRRGLLRTGLGIPDFLEQYPCLMWKNEMLQEMSKMVNSNISVDEFKARLESVAPSLLSMAKTKGDNDCKLSAALLALPELLREKLSAIMVFEVESEANKDTPPKTEESKKDTFKRGKSKVHPHIRVTHGDYNIFCEGVKIASSEYIPEIWCLLLVAYFVYDLEYPKQAQNTFTFMEVKLFDIKRKEKLPRCTHSLLNELAKLK